MSSKPGKKRLAQVKRGGDAAGSGSADLSARLVSEGDSNASQGESDEAHAAVASSGAIEASHPAHRSSRHESEFRGPVTVQAGVFAPHPHFKADGSSFSSGARKEHLHASGSTSAAAQGHDHRDVELMELGSDAHVVRLHEQDENARRLSLATGEDTPAIGAGSRRGGEENDSLPRSPRRPWPSVLRDGWKPYLRSSFREVLFSTKLNWLLLAVPLAIISKLGGWGSAPLFVFSLIGLCPLAERISFLTDEMAKYTNGTVGGLLSATMGNATELIVSIFALQRGLLRVVQLSLLGSILSNLLLVQGTAFLVGGLKFKQQSYSQAAAKTNISLLLLAVLALALPMVLIASNPSDEQAALANQVALALGVLNITSSSSSATAGAGSDGMANAGEGALSPIDIHEGITLPSALSLSRMTAVLLLVVYALLILYQLRTHAHLFESREEQKDTQGGGDASANDDSENGGSVSLSGGGGDADAADSDDDDPPVLGPWGSVLWAVVITIFISVLSEFIVSAIEGAAVQIHLPVLFSATILLPIVGNAAEHAAAVVFAGRNQMDVALGIAVGSSTQIALFVIPLCVVVGWMGGQPLSLDFQVFETVSLLLTVVMSSLILSTGKSDWLYGVMMIVAYVIIAGAFWLQKQPDSME